MPPSIFLITNHEKAGSSRRALGEGSLRGNISLWVEVFAVSCVTAAWLWLVAHICDGAPHLPELADVGTTDLNSTPNSFGTLPFPPVDSPLRFDLHAPDFGHCVVSKGAPFPIFRSGGQSTPYRIAVKIAQLRSETSECMCSGMTTYPYTRNRWARRKLSRMAANTVWRFY
jgi:hypothetical protein